MHNNSLGQATKQHQSPNNKFKHARDDSSLDKNNKLKTTQSCRRIITEQSGKIYLKPKDAFLKKQIEHKNINQNTGQINLTQTVTQQKQNKYSSCKNLKNLKSSPSNKKIQNYHHYFSPKNKPHQNGYIQKQASTKDLFVQKSLLKKVASNKTNIITKINKGSQEDKISHFVLFPVDKLRQKPIKSPLNANNKKKHEKMDFNKSKQQKKIFKSKAEGKSKALKTLQNQQTDIYKHINSNKQQLTKKRKAGKQKMYHNVKMKTEQSMISCQSTPSQIFTHQIDFMQQIGEGTFGKVYKGVIKKTLQVVAIKKVYQDKKYKNRQIEIVSQLNSSSFIMKVFGTYMSYQATNSQNPKQYLNIVMKYYQSDLFKDIQQKKTLTNMEIKLYSYQIFRGLLYLHSKNICHRDIKPHNILTNNMSVALCDFGSAKILHPNQKNLPYICSRCYRAPQLIFGSTNYTTMIDVWSVGCVILQMIHGTPFFIGNSSIDHLIEVIKVLGTPTKTQVKQMNPQYDLKDYKFPNIKSKPFQKLFLNTDPLLISLLEQIMIYAPKQRLNAAEALVHEYFDELREQEVYKRLCSQYDLPDFFDFTPEQMKQNQHLYGQLVPQWYTKTHFTYFQDQQIEKNNTLKLYFD